MKLFQRSITEGMEVNLNDVEPGDFFKLGGMDFMMLSQRNPNNNTEHSDRRQVVSIPTGVIHHLPTFIKVAITKSFRNENFTWTAQDNGGLK